MSSGPRNEMLIGLIRLQAIDDQIYRIRRRLADGPRLVERRSAGLRLAETRLADGHDRLQKAKAQVAERELDLKTKEGEVQKLVQQQSTARTNQEYKAFGDHILRVKKDCSGLEDSILESFQTVEEAEERERLLLQVKEEAVQEAGEIQKSWNRDEQEYRQDLEKIEGRRDEQCQSLPKGPLQVYEKILKAFDGLAVVPMEGRVCGGCQMAVTRNDEARLHGKGNELITCRSCERILFVPGLHQATT